MINNSDFIRLLNTFVDPGDSITKDDDQICFSVGGNGYLLSTQKTGGSLLVKEQHETEYMPADKWVINKLAHLDLLASRISELIEEPKNFIPPSVILNINSTEKLSENNGLNELRDYIDQKQTSFQTHILYLVSNAGEGKSTLLSKLAIDQANKYRRGEANWLLLPIQLGGRPFMRFDDITIGVLQNKYRFQYLYYNSFIELVKMGLIVPAFDGFEEMFVESSTKEAFTAMSNLVEVLDSSGTMVIAARKAYFDFDNIKIKEIIIDKLRQNDVVFDKFDIQRWNKDQFVNFATLCLVNNPNSLYERLLLALDNNSEHPILTRPVFVKKLLEICMTPDSQDDFVTKIQSANTNFLRAFIESIIKRESDEKWIDRGGMDRIESPLLTQIEHFELLSSVAQMMWESQKDSVELSTLSFIAEYFGETHFMQPNQVKEIIARLPSHALIVRSTSFSQSALQYSFEHESFRMFFLGFAIARLITEYNEGNSYLDLRNILRLRILPIEVVHSIVEFLKQEFGDHIIATIKLLVNFCSFDEKTSFTQENTSNIIIRLLNDVDFQNSELKNLQFPINALRSRRLKNIYFKNCYFARTSVTNSKFENCIFKDCVFENLCFSLESDEKRLQWINSSLQDSKVHSIMTETQVSLWNPEEISALLKEEGYVKEEEFTPSTIAIVPVKDEKLECFEKILRYFMRSTHISDSVIRKKAGDRYLLFQDEILPVLLEKQIFIEIQNRSSDNQSRFRLGVSFSSINAAMMKAQGSFQDFLSALKVVQ